MRRTRTTALAVLALLNVFTLIPAQHLNSYVMAFMRYLAGTLILLLPAAALVVSLGVADPFASLRVTPRLGRVPFIMPFCSG